MMMAEGIYKFKCATIAEAEMLGITKAKRCFAGLSACWPKTETLHSTRKNIPTHFIPV